MFCLSFVVVTVKARLAGLDSRFEQAAMDLYANEWQAFWRVTFPLVFPGIMAAALLAFSLSFDDFIVTNFNHGNTITFPMYVWGAAQRGIPPHVNVIGTVMFAGGPDSSSCPARCCSAVAHDEARTGHAAPSLTDARPAVYWLDDPARPAAAPALSGVVRADLVVVGGRLHRSLDGAAGQGAGSVDRRGRARGARPLRRPGQRAQRRLRLDEPHPRARQRADALARGDGRRSTGWGPRTSTRSARPSSGTASTAGGNAPAS